MNKYSRLPIPNGRMGLLLTICGIKNTAIIEYGPSGTTHFAMDFLRGTGENINNLYCAHIEEKDILFGSTKKLEKAILELDSKNIFKYIFVVSTSITELIGIDLENCCELIEDKVKAKLVPVTKYSNDITFGIKKGLELLIKSQKLNSNLSKNKFNIIGITKEECYFKSNQKSIENLMEEFFKLKLNCNLGCSSTIEEIENFLEAKINIVTRIEGLEIAKYLKEKYDIPYTLVNFYSFKNVEESLKNIEIALNKERISYLSQDDKGRIEKLKTFFKYKLDGVKLNVLIAGNYFECYGLTKILEEDLGIEVSEIVVNHELSLLHKEYLKGFEVRLINRRDWEEKERYDIVLGDEEILNALNYKVGIRVSNPNISARFFSNENSFMGIEGILKIGERILNIL